MPGHDVDAVRAAAIPLPASGSVEPISDLVGDESVVLIGEATHGTHEFYRIRADLTRELILRKGFNVVAVEADWPDAFRANRWVRGESTDSSARDALSDFQRFPRWMWRNSDVVRFLGWLHDYNHQRGPREQAGFYGLDLYSLHRSIDAVLRYLRTVDPASEIRARERYACFDPFGVDTQAYGYATTAGLEPSCEQAVIGQLVELQRKAADYASRDGRVAAEDYFAAEQNARVVRDAEAYYRAMFGDGAKSWNLRDRHMMSTLEAILAHVTRLNGTARAVIWAHNSHLGDARATQMSAYGELNVGQLVREAYGKSAIPVGFTTHEGSVTAALNWDEPAGLMAVRPSIAAATSASFTSPAFNRSPSTFADRSPPRCERRGWSARSAWCTGRNRSVRATTSLRRWPSSSMSSCTATAPGPSSRSSGGRATRSTCRRPGRRGCKGNDGIVDPAGAAMSDIDLEHQTGSEQIVHVPVGRVRLEGALAVPAQATSIVVFAHGSGSSRHSPRNNAVARVFRQAGLGTFLLDLLTAREDASYETRFDIRLLTERLTATTTWLHHQPASRRLRIGYFGASTGAAAALDAAAELPDDIAAVVSRGGRPDLATRLDSVAAATLLIVGSEDYQVLDLNRRAYADLRCKKDLAVVTGATHLFEEPGTLDEVARLSSAWFRRYLSPEAAAHQG